MSIQPFKLKWKMIGSGRYVNVERNPKAHPTYLVKKLKNGWGAYKYNDETNRYYAIRPDNYFYPADSLDGAIEIAEYEYTMGAICYSPY